MRRHCALLRTRSRAIEEESGRRRTRLVGNEGHLQGREDMDTMGLEDEVVCRPLGLAADLVALDHCLLNEAVREAWDP